MWPYHLHVLIQNVGASSSWKHQGLSWPGFTFCLINIPNKCLDNGGPWRILLVLNFGTEWMRVIGSCSGCRTTQDRTHHIDRLSWYHSLVECCTRSISPPSSRSTSVQSVFTLFRESLSWAKVTWIRLASLFCTVRCSIIPSVSASYSRPFPSSFPNKILLLNHLRRFCSVECVINR
jgi:hypothetical protein